MADVARGDLMADVARGDFLAARSKLGSLDPQMVRELFRRSKELADAQFHKGCFAEALEQYAGTLFLADTATQRAVLLSNKSACYHSLQRNEEALTNAAQAIELCPKWYKAWYRASEALAGLGEYERVIKVIDHAINLVKKSDLNETEEKQRLAQLARKKTNALEAQAKIKRREKYSVDYRRFDALLEDQTQNDDDDVNQMAPNDGNRLSNGLEVEFSKELSQEQKDLLTAQLTTGQFPESAGMAPILGQTTIRTKKKKPIDLSSYNCTVCNAEDEENQMSHVIKAVKLLLEKEGEIKFFEKLFILYQSSQVYRKFIKSLCRCVAKLRSGTDKQKLVLWTSGWSSLKPIFGDIISTYTNDRFTKLLTNHNASVAAVEEVGRQPAHFESHMTQDHISTVMTENNRYIAVIDPVTVEGYLFGPSFPLIEQNRQAHPTAQIFPDGIVLKCALAEVKGPPSFVAKCVASASQWSLLPLQISRPLFKRISLRTPFVNVRSFKESIPDGEIVIELPLDAVNNPAFNAVIFTLEFSHLGESLLDVWESFSQNELAPNCNLSPCFYWLKENDSITNDTESNASAQMSLLFRRGILLSAAVRLGHRCFRSDFEIFHSLDPVKWSNAVDESNMNAWRSGLADLMLRRRQSLGNGQSLFETLTASTRATKTTNVTVGTLSCGTSDEFLALIESVFDPHKINRGGKASVAVGTGGLEDISLICLTANDNIAKIYLEMIHDAEILKYLIRRWNEHQNNHNSTGIDVSWKTNGNTANQTTATITAEAESLRIRLHSRTDSEPPRVRIEMATAETVRAPDHQKTEQVVNVCRLLQVPPDTPGVSNVNGCVVLDRKFDILIIAPISELPTDGISSNLIPIIQFAKDSLCRNPNCPIFPRGLRLNIQLGFVPVRPETILIEPDSAVFNTTFAHLNERFLELLRYGSNALSKKWEGHMEENVFPWLTERVSIGAGSDGWKSLGGFAMSEVATAINISFDGSCIELKRKKNVKLTMAQANNIHGVNAVLLWADWQITEDEWFSNAPISVPMAGRRQCVQFLPYVENVNGVEMMEIELIMAPDFSDYLLKWPDRTIRTSSISDGHQLDLTLYELKLREYLQRSRESYENLILKLGGQLVVASDCRTQIREALLHMLRCQKTAGKEDPSADQSVDQSVDPPADLVQSADVARFGSLERLGSSPVDAEMINRLFSASV